MRRLLDRGHAAVTSLGGLLEVGAVAAAAAAGAELGHELLWAFVLGGVCLVLLVEMSSRFATATRQTVVGAMRARFGFDVCLVPLVGVFLVTLLVLAMEIAGVALSLELATGIDMRFWAPTSAFGVWLLLWTSRFRLFNFVVSLLGLLGVVYLVVAVRVGPSWDAIAHGLVPHLPPSGAPGGLARYGFLAAVALGAMITPSLFHFYSSGVVAERWTPAHRRTNRAAALFGVALRTVLALSAVIVAAAVLVPHGARFVDARRLPELLVGTLGPTGRALFVASLGIASFAAAAELALVAGYLVSQALGWNFGPNERPRENARFAIVYTVAIIVAAIVPLSGVDPMLLALVAMAFTAVTLPLAVFPFLVLMNDERYLGPRKNHVVGNVVVTAIVALAVLLAVVTIPLQLGG